METSFLAQNRLLSIDFFRGLTMFFLIAEFTHLFNYMVDPVFEGTIIHFIGIQLQHHPWHGLRFWDLIQPFFMFIVGVSMPLSYLKRLKKGDLHNKIFRHIAKRSFLLLLLGWWLYCIEAGKIVFLFQNVLAQLSVTILIAFLIMRKSAISQIIISFGLLAFTELVYRDFWIDGFNQPFTPDKNFGAWFDLLISGQLSSGHWTSINAIPTTAHTIWGVLAGKLLMSSRENKKKLLILVIGGITWLIIGYSLDSVTPIIKRISTTSFVFVSGGWAVLGLAFSFWLIEIMKFKKGVLFFAVVGMNPLFIYIFAHIGGACIITDVIYPFTDSIFSFGGKLTVDIITSFLVAISLWYICYWMYKKKLFIKI